MPEEGSQTIIDEVKKTSDGQVKISVEKYNEMLETIGDQKGSISGLRAQLREARSAPPVVHRTVVHKTAEMVANEHRVWGGSLMGLGATMFVIGAFRYRAGKAWTEKP